MTDGRSSRTSSTIAAAKEVRDSGIFLFAIGVGNADKTELQSRSLQSLLQLMVWRLHSMLNLIG